MTPQCSNLRNCSYYEAESSRTGASNNAFNTCQLQSLRYDHSILQYPTLFHSCRRILSAFDFPCCLSATLAAISAANIGTTVNLQRRGYGVGIAIKRSRAPLSPILGRFTSLGATWDKWNLKQTQNRLRKIFGLFVNRAPGQATHRDVPLSRCGLILYRPNGGDAGNCRSSVALAIQTGVVDSEFVLSPYRHRRRHCAVVGSTIFVISSSLACLSFLSPFQASVLSELHGAVISRKIYESFISVGIAYSTLEVII